MTAFDVLPSGYGAIPLPVHAMRWDFPFTLAPLRIVGGTGGPVNPIVTF